MESTAFIQWNCRGIKNKMDEIKLLLQSYNPIACCLQETFIRDEDVINFSQYTSFHQSSQVNNGKACGGVSILIRNDIPHDEVKLNTPLQAKAIEISIHKKITICSIYIPPSTNLDPKMLDDLVQQLPAPFMLLGDFNAHNMLWGCNDFNSKGRKIETFIGKHDLCYLNDKSYTYIHPATGSTSAIDLTLCDASLFLDFQWKVSDDLCGSDHFPILVNTTESVDDDKVPRWRLHKADWTKFQQLCAERLDADKFASAADPMGLFTSILHDIAEECIPKTSTKSKRPYYPWFTDDCKHAIKLRKKALAIFKRQPTQTNLQNFRLSYAQARRTIRKCKKKSWRDYVSRLNARTPIKKTWDMVRKISGKYKRSPICYLKTSNKKATTKKEISNILAENFEHNSSSRNYTPQFQKFKTQQEKKPLNFRSDNSEKYNRLFSIRELQDSLHKSHDTSVGPDDIHYQIIKHLPDLSMHTMLHLFNGIWECGNFPPSWREATVIPIPKPGKDHAAPSSYRPIALTSCICKTMERMINNRLVWYLESNHIITEFQSGFRRQRSTTDHLVRFETLIREAFIKKEHMVAVFFDLEKAYDTTWKYGILKDLHDVGLRGNMPNFISNFLTDRQFKVRVGSTLSDLFEQEMGVPQGSILSVTLFSLKINNIVNYLNTGVDCSLYVDDFLISYHSKHMYTAERQLQQCLNRLQTWSNENGFKFSTTKTVCVHFCQQRKHHPDPSLTLNGAPIPVVPETKFLGLIFDSKLSFIPHLKYLKAKCLKALNLLKVVAKTDWGADRKVLLRLYRSLVRSKLDYGSIVYGSARKSYLQMLNPIANQSLRLCLGAFRTSPVESLHVEANELSLSRRREKLSLQYALKLSANPDNPTYNSTFEPKYEDLFDRKPNAIPTFGIRIKHHLSNMNFSLGQINRVCVPQEPPWTLKMPHVILDLCNNRKAETSPDIFKSKFLEVKSRYRDHSQIYTDGSKDNNRVAAAAVMKDIIYLSRLLDKASIYSAELKAIDLALRYINLSTRDKFIIFSDSKSCLQGLQCSTPDNPSVSKVLKNYNSLVSRGKTVVFCWLPSHIGIRGNEEADRAAKEALDNRISCHNIPYTDFKCHIRQYMMDIWQTDWDDIPVNKLKEIKPELGESHHDYFTCRKDEVVLCRARIGHSYYTNAYLLKNEPQPECIPCQEPLTVKHILIDCVDFSHVRSNYFQVNSIKQLFDTVNANKILAFLKEINLYNKF